MYSNQTIAMTYGSGRTDPMKSPGRTDPVSSDPWSKRKMHYGSRRPPVKIEFMFQERGQQKNYVNI